MTVRVPLGLLLQLERVAFAAAHPQTWQRLSDLILRAPRDASEADIVKGAVCRLEPT